MSSGENTSTVVGITLISGGKNYSKNVLINWKGWRMVSIRLSDFRDKNGNPMPDALKTSIIDMGLNAATHQGQGVEMDLDFVIFTKTYPFFH